MQPNMTALNCQNQKCVCGSVPIPTTPPGSGQLPPNPFQVPFSMWNCGNSGKPINLFHIFMQGLQMQEVYN